MSLTITFEEASRPAIFAHISSENGILGHAAEVRARIPVGTWLTVAPEHQPALTAWLTAKCGFAFQGCLVGATGLEDVLLKVRM